MPSSPTHCFAGVLPRPRKLRWTVVFAAACMLGLLAPAAARSQDSGNLTGRWVLNRSQSQVDKEVGFTPVWLAAAPGVPIASRVADGGGQGRRGSGGGQQGGVRRAARERGRRPARAAALGRSAETVTASHHHRQPRHGDHHGCRRCVAHCSYGWQRRPPTDPGLPVTAVTVRDSGHVVVRYKVEQGRELRYTYTRETGGQS